MGGYAIALCFWEVLDSQIIVSCGIAEDSKFKGAKIMKIYAPWGCI